MWRTTAVSPVAAGPLQDVEERQLPSEADVLLQPESVEHVVDDLHGAELPRHVREARVALICRCRRPERPLQVKLKLLERLVEVGKRPRKSSDSLSRPLLRGSKWKPMLWRSLPSDTQGSV